MRVSKSQVLMKMVAGAAICAGSVPATAAPACVAGAQGCVLPLRDAVVQTPAPEAPVPVQVVEPVVVDEPKSFPWLALLGLAAAAVAAYLLFADDSDTNAVPLSP